MSVEDSQTGETLTKGDGGAYVIQLGGSLARGTARADSDLDILAVSAAHEGVASWRSRTRALPVDFLVHTAGQWQKHFVPDRVGDESSGYAFESHLGNL